MLLIDSVDKFVSDPNKIGSQIVLSFAGFAVDVLWEVTYCFTDLISWFTEQILRSGFLVGQI